MTDRQLSLADVARYPRPGMDAPGSVTFTPDSRKVAYLQGKPGSLIQELWTYDLESRTRHQVTHLTGRSASADASFSLDEELRRERSRTRESGVTRSEERRVGKECRSRWSP